MWGQGDASRSAAGTFDVAGGACRGAAGNLALALLCLGAPKGRAPQERGPRNNSPQPALEAAPRLWLRAASCSSRQILRCGPRVVLEADEAPLHC
jgi:hypothetical protein